MAHFKFYIVILSQDGYIMTLLFSYAIDVVTSNFNMMAC